MRWGRRLAQQLGGASFKTPDPPRGREKISLLDYDPRLQDVDYVSSDPGHVPHGRFPSKFVIAVLAFIGVSFICAIRGGGFSMAKHLPRVVRAYDKRMQEFVEKMKRKPFARSSSRP